eukprot:NODE_643_length_5630_cov_0.163623.p3 type:complete len:122 gc:universal NODE_643_length_5630_cov_0.163623:1573-1938(+)
MNPFISQYAQRFSLSANKLVPFGDGPIHVHAYPNHVCALYLDKELCVSFATDIKLKELFLVKSKKFNINDSTVLGSVKLKDGSEICISAFKGQLLELHDREPIDEWQDYFALITSKQKLSL